MSLIAISPTANQTLDAGQTLAINVSVINDSSHSGATLSLTGPGTLTTGTSYYNGDTLVLSATYAAPSTVTAASTAVVTATSVNTPSQKASVTINLNSALAITTTTLPAGTVGTPYSATIASTGGTAPLTFSGTLPAGLSLSPAGVISGTPTAFGTFNFTVSLKDSATSPVTVTQAYTLTINPRPPAITTTTLPNATSGSAYSQQLTYTGGSGATPSFAIASGTLPPGLTLSASGLISGSPTNAAVGNTYSFAVTVTVGSQTSAAASLSIMVYALPVITTTSLPSGNIGIPYSQTLSYSGGNGSTPTFAITAGSLPAASGLTLNTATGGISGKPTAATTYSFSVAVTVGPQTSASQAYTLVINSLVISSGATASGEVSLPFAFHLTAAGGTGPYTWSLATGSAALPPGLTGPNATTGVISGTPTTTTGSPFTGIVIKATDSLGATATQAMTFTIYPARTNTQNSALKGTYAFLLSGFDASGKPLVSAGSFAADGNGNILTGSLDINGTGLTAPTANATLLPATYAAGPDNRGKITLTTASGSSTYVFALNSITAGVAGGGYLTEFDTSGQALSGVFALQSTATLSGGYALGLEGFAANSTATSLVHRAVIGETQVTIIGTIASAEFLSTGSGSATPIVPTAGTLLTGVNGRATLSYTLPNGGGKIDLVIYVVSAARFFIISADAASGSGAADLLSGQALQQTTTNGNFNAASLKGISVMHSQKLQVATNGYVPDAQVGLFTFSGAGTLSLVSDENNGGVVTADALSGPYTVAPNGRVSFTLSSAIGGCINCVSTQTFFYLAGPNQGFMMDFSTPVAFGAFEPQTSTGFSLASLNGTYSAGTLDPLAPSVADSEGSFIASGTGTISGTTDQNSAGTLSPDNAIAATYTVGSTGRTPLTINGSVGPVLYIVSPTKAISLDLSSSSPVIEEVEH
jgi:hypothetical protein